MNVGGDVFEVGEVYEWDGRDVVFRGSVPYSAVGMAPGLYYDGKAGEFVEVPEEPTGEQEELEAEGATELSHREGQTARKIRGVSVSKEKDEDQKGQDADGPLWFEPDEEDDEMVACLKEAINSAKVTQEEVAGRLGENPYNMIYGLRRRHAVTWVIFRKWAAIIGMTPTVGLVPEEGEK